MSHVLQDPATTAFLRDVVAGLSREPKSIPCKYFYDARGSALFEAITMLPEYYPTAAEIEILTAYAAEMSVAIGPRALLLELGSGSSTKTRILLDRLQEPAAYVPIDISEDHLRESAAALRSDYRHLTIIPVAADYTEHVELPPMPPHDRKVAFFPGSTIGNMGPGAAGNFLRRVAGFVGRDGGLLIGVDLPKDRAVLEAAYDDPQGVTAQFNLNLLERLQRELDAEIDSAHFKHVAVWNEDASRMEMYLESTVDQEVTVVGHRFSLAAGERIHTENSHKYAPHVFTDLAAQGGFRIANTWLDDQERFSVHFLQAP